MYECRWKHVGEIVNQLECFLSIIIIRIYYKEWFFYYILTA